MNLMAGTLRRLFPKSMEEPIAVESGNDAEIAVAIAAAKAFAKS
jgi:hypothetical protein